MYWEILDEERQAVLRRLSENVLPDGCYMAGGTALSLQMKLRKSFSDNFKRYSCGTCEKTQGHADFRYCC